MAHTTADSSSGYFDAGFDYRSLLPTSENRSSAAQDFGNDNSNDAGEQCIPSLTFRERCIGCGTCVVAGYLLSMGSFWRFKGLVTGNPTPFVVNATVGNLIALAGSFFLMGPKAQLARMFHPSRRFATQVYITCLAVTTLVLLLPLPFKGLLLIVLIIAQYVAVAWYCLSYIPFAQDAVTGYLQRAAAGVGEG